MRMQVQSLALLGGFKDLALLGAVEIGCVGGQEAFLWGCWQRRGCGTQGAGEERQKCPKGLGNYYRELDMEGKTETEKGRNSRGNSIGKGGIDKQVYGVSLGLGWVGVARCEPKAFI